MAALASLFGPLLVGAVLAWAGFAKSLDPSSTVVVLRSQPLTRELAQPLLWGLVVVEIVVGTALLLGVRSKPLLLGALGLLAAFSIQLSLLWAWNDPRSCGCLGGSTAATRDDHLLGIARNVALAALVLPGFKAPSWRGE